MRARLILSAFVLFALAIPALAQERRGAPSLDRVLPHVRQTVPGTFYDAEGPFPGQDGRMSYRLKWMTPDGRVIWFSVDAQSGQVIGGAPRGVASGRGRDDGAAPGSWGPPRNNWRQDDDNRGGWGGGGGNNQGGWGNDRGGSDNGRGSDRGWSRDRDRGGWGGGRDTGGDNGWRGNRGGGDRDNGRDNGRGSWGNDGRGGSWGGEGRSDGRNDGRNNDGRGGGGRRHPGGG